MVTYLVKVSIENAERNLDLLGGNLKSTRHRVECSADKSGIEQVWALLLYDDFLNVRLVTPDVSLMDQG